MLSYDVEPNVSSGEPISRIPHLQDFRVDTNPRTIFWLSESGHGTTSIPNPPNDQDVDQREDPDPYIGKKDPDLAAKKLGIRINPERHLTIPILAHNKIPPLANGNNSLGGSKY